MAGLHCTFSVISHAPHPMINGRHHEKELQAFRLQLLFDCVYWKTLPSITYYSASVAASVSASVEASTDPSNGTTAPL